MSAHPNGIENAEQARRNTLQAKNREPAEEVAELTLEQRFDKLEKTVRFWRSLTLLLICAVLGLGGGIAVMNVRIPNTLQARRIEVMNDKGVAVELTSSSDGDGFVTVNSNIGAPRLMLGTSKRGFGMLEIYSGHQQRMVGIGGSGSGGQVSLFNNSGKRVVDLQSSKTNCGAIAVNDFDGALKQGLTGEFRQHQ